MLYHPLIKLDIGCQCTAGFSVPQIPFAILLVHQPGVIQGRARLMVWLALVSLIPHIIRISRHVMNIYLKMTDTLFWSTTKEEQSD